MVQPRFTDTLRISDNDVTNRDIPSFIEPLPPLISNPFMRPKPVKGTNLMDLFEESELQEPDSVQVYLRMKPCNKQSNLYEVRSEKCLITSMDTTTAGHGRRTQHNVSKMYTFSNIFTSESSQKEVFEHVVKDNLKKLPDGHSYTLLTYGASGSGKTYTLMGTVSSPGLVPRSLEYIFRIVDASQQPLFKPSDSGAEKLSYEAQDQELQWVKKLRNLSAPLRDKYRRMSVQLKTDLSVSNMDLTNRTKYYVWVSFVEIYNEAVYDLLVMSDRRTASKLRIRDDSTGLAYVKGATQAFVRSGEEAYDVMVAGKHNLQVAATGVHAHSSRSHCIFTITLLTEKDGEVRPSWVRLCDLAGSERAARTNNSGTRLMESRAINSSLHVFERCLHNMRHKRQAVPYRESKLTRLLGSGLSGRGGEAVSMVVTINPDPLYAYETKHVLQLAAVAKDIQINSTIAESSLTANTTQDTTLATNNEVMKLRVDNERLHYELEQALIRQKQLTAAMKEKQLETASTIKDLVNEAKDMTKEFYEAQIVALEERYKAEIEDLTAEYENKLRGVPTPSKSQQNAIIQLQAEIALLEEKLHMEMLARAGAEQEVQHLRACIDERDSEKEAELNSLESKQEEDNASDVEVSSEDEMNESLEPSFKKEVLNTTNQLNKTKQNDNIYNDTTIEFKKLSAIDKINEEQSLHTTYCSDYDDTLGKNEDTSVLNDTKDNTQNIVSNKSKKDFSRGTYFVSSANLDETVDSGCVSKTNKDITIDVRSSTSAKDNLELSKNYIEEVNISFEGKKIGRMSKTMLNKLKSSINKNETNNESLALFEQFEKDVQVENKNSKDVKVLKEKINYFEDNKETLVADIEVKQKKSFFDDDVNKNNEQPATENVKEKSYFGNEPSAILNKDSEDNKNGSKINESSKEKERFSVFGDIKMLKEKRTYFADLDDKKNVSGHLLNPNSSLNPDDLRSPSIVKEEIPKDYEPTTIKKLLGESLNSSSKSRLMSKIHDSTDMFEDDIFTQPEVKENTVENLRKSLCEISIKAKVEPEVKQIIEEKEMDKNETEDCFKVPKSRTKVDTTINDTTVNRCDDTVTEFENIFKDISTVRATEFELLVSEQDIIEDIVKQNVDLKGKEDKNTKEPNFSVENNVKIDICDNKTELTKEKVPKDEAKSVKYNLRHKTQLEIDEEAKLTIQSKRSLRLRRRKNVNTDEVEDVKEKPFDKLKDIANLQKEFSDVMMDEPVAEKVVKDIPTPEKENCDGLLDMETMSCPSKSVSRSRRKLFTPRAEPLDDMDVDQSVDCDERVRVPRPSYHKGRARRKL